MTVTAGTGCPARSALRDRRGCKKGRSGCSDRPLMQAYVRLFHALFVEAVLIGGKVAEVFGKDLLHVGLVGAVEIDL